MLNDDLIPTLKAVADDTRLGILRLLKRDSLAASELAQLLEIKQSALSHHLKILSQGKWLKTRREGSTLFYRRQLDADLSIARIQQSILTGLDQVELSQSQLEALEDIRSARQQISAEFFENHAYELDSITDRIAGYRHYSDALHDRLSSISLSHLQTALEIGPGDGGFLPYLSDKFEQVIALDISEPMLELARSQVQDLLNVRFIHGDLQTAIKENLHADFVALNMVLHHVPSPVSLLNECWKILNQEGWLLITDLCAHEQTWVQEACGDFWMGFDTDELLNWAIECGFKASAPILLGLKNGFQVQIHLLQKHVNHPSAKALK